MSAPEARLDGHTTACVLASLKSDRSAPWMFWYCTSRTRASDQPPPLPKSDVADNGLERAIARELCQPCIVKRAGAGYRLRDNLHLSVSLRGDIVT